MRALWFVGCIGYALHILASLDKPALFGIAPNYWVPFSVVSAAVYAFAGIRALFIKRIPSWF